MARRAREWTVQEVKQMIELFNAGESTERIGKRQTPPASAQVIGRVLSLHLGNLNTARSMARVHRLVNRGRLRHLEYREGFHAGYRMAITHMNLHGIEPTREHCKRTLLSWRDTGLDDMPPAFARSP